MIKYSFKVYLDGDNDPNQNMKSFENLYPDNEKTVQGYSGQEVQVKWTDSIGGKENETSKWNVPWP